ncbi:DNA cytosine methyltransferase [Levilactobacillus brevis]|uniref:DNA cytosine methyltransferase n=1 Tax=Levilactobacillus brevis TaxID=1580 RepID=UPI0021A95746|nr:DNA cytosine methyltransferase [Levilactobacillus brevis]MCT3583356.1 DNA cytosine methyltransferase [Levilactobacillus brevis]
MEQLLSISDCAEKLRTSSQFVRNQIKNKSLKGEKVGKGWVVKYDDLLSWIKETDFIVEPKDHPRLTDNIPSKIAFSFFTGAGGLDIGMAEAGIHPVLVSDIDKHARKSIARNYPNEALIGDVTQYNANKIYEYARIPRDKQVDYMFGGPPCQAFSTAGRRRGYGDARGDVFIKYLDLIGEIKPRYAIIENVRGLLSIPAIFDSSEDIGVKGGVLFYALKKLRSFGYSVSFDLYNAANFGASETRERVIIIAKLGNKKVDYLEPTNSKNGELGLPLWKTFGDSVFDIEDQPQHYIEYPAKRMRFIKFVPEGGNWRSLPEEMQKEAMGKSYSLPGGKTGFYRRLSFSKPAPTLVTHPTMPATDLIHPKLNRPLSVEEYARIQGFPDDWTIEGTLLDKYKQIGNAVPVNLAKAIGNRIVEDENGRKLPKHFWNFKNSRYKNTKDEEWESNMLKTANRTIKQADKEFGSLERQISLF